MTNVEVLRVAGEAGCDPRTVRRYERGDTVKPMVGERIRAAMKKLGLKGVREATKRDVWPKKT